MESCTSLYRALKEKGFKASKRWGQNFLVDDNIREIILEASHIAPGSKILEVGPGNGVLTWGLLARGAEVWAIEKDPRLYRYLQEFLGNHPSLHLIEGDVMKTPIEDLPPEKLVANLPYNITSPLLYRLWEMEGRYREMIIMVQWEAAQRLTAPSGTKDYSLITVLFATTHEVEVVHRVSRH